MKKARKRPVVVQAYRLGDESRVMDELTAEGEIRLKGDGSFEVFSLEAAGETGEIAHTGDYIKLDSFGRPYPNEAGYFKENHSHIAADYYEQHSHVVPVWMYGDPLCPEIVYLMEHCQLKMHEEDPAKYFQAPLWGTMLYAAKDAVIVFYKIVRDESGNITDEEFNFVARDEFDSTYELLPDEDEKNY